MSPLYADSPKIGGLTRNSTDNGVNQGGWDSLPDLAVDECRDVFPMGDESVNAAKRLPTPSIAAPLQ